MISEENQIAYRRYYHAAIKGGCDAAQARSIAMERTLRKIMEADATVVDIRNRMAGNVVRLQPR